MASSRAYLPYSKRSPGAVNAKPSPRAGSLLEALLLRRDAYDRHIV